MRITGKPLILIPLLLTIALYSHAQEEVIQSVAIYNHISYLASDSLAGRRTGSKGEEIASKYIANQFKKYGLEPKGNDHYYQLVTLKYRSNPQDSTEKKIESIQAKNIVGYLDNHAPYTVVIGAHYDHLGLGEDHNSLEANAEGQIHNGADDNASGVAGLLELARALGNNNITENNNYLFIAFTGEELGLLGSKKWCDSPTINLSSINFMINMDMIGRLNDSTKKLIISGVGTSSNWIKQLDKVNSYFSLKLDSSGTGPSDHTSFYNKNIPVLHFFSGQHMDYHKSTDDLDKINIEGTKKIVDLIYTLILEADTKDKIAFYQTAIKEEGRSKKYKVSLGIMPDYASDIKGLRIDGVTKGKPAEKAGMQAGDILIRFNGTDIDDIYGYMKALGEVEQNQKVPITILRGDNKIELEVDL